MKTLDRPTRAEVSTTQGIQRALIRARRTAAKVARMHKVPLVYLRDGKIVREHP